MNTMRILFSTETETMTYGYYIGGDDSILLSITTATTTDEFCGYHSMDEGDGEDNGDAQIMFYKLLLLLLLLLLLMQQTPQP